MSNGSPVSSPFASPGIDQVFKQAERAPAADPFSAAIEAADALRQEKTALAATWARQFQPDVYAKVKDLAGMAPEVAIRNLPEIERAQKLTVLGDLFKSAPGLQNYFADNSRNLALAEPEELAGFWDAAQNSRAKHLQDVVAGLYGPGGPGQDDATRLRQAAQTFRSEANLYFQHDRRDALHEVARAIETGVPPADVGRLLQSALKNPERNLVSEIAQLGIGVPRGAIATFGAGLKGQAVVAESGEAGFRESLLRTIAEARNPQFPGDQDEASRRLAFTERSANQLTALREDAEELVRLRESGRISEEEYQQAFARQQEDFARLDTEEFIPTEWNDATREQFAAESRAAGGRRLRLLAQGQMDGADREIMLDIAQRLEAGEDLEVGRLSAFGTPMAAADREAFRLGQVFQDVAQEYFGATPGYEETFAAEMGDAFGSLAAFVALGASVGPIGTFAAAGLMGVSDQYERAIAAGLSPEEATSVAMYGLGPGAVQALSIEFLLQRLPRGAREEFNTWLRGVTESAGAEAAVESAGMLLQNALEQTYNPDRDLMDGVVNAGIISGVSAGALRGVLASYVPRTIERMRGLQEAAGAINDAQAARRLTGDLFAQAGENGLAQRAPKEAAEIIDAMQPGERRWIDPNAVVAFAQAEGTDAYALPLENWQTRLTEALRTGTEVELSLGEFVATFGTNPNATPLLDLTRHSPGAFTGAEIQQYRDEAMAAAEGTLQQQFSGDEIMPQLMEILQGANQTPEETATVARLMAEFFGTMAGREGVDMTPEGLLNSARLMVQSMTQPDGLQGMALAEGQPAVNQVTGDQIAIESLGVEPTQLTQTAGTVTRGMIEFTGQPIEKVNEPAPGSFYATISLFEQANKSTLLHEFGHYTLNVMRDLSAASPEIAADYARIRKHLGLAEGAPITREHHEQYAKWFEAYLFTGMAPSNALVPVFRKLKDWFKKIYKQLANLGGKIDPELQQVFDRMFAAEAKFDEAEAAYRPLFTEAAEMGVSPEDFFDFMNLVQTIRQDGQDRARTRIIGQEERLATGWFKQIENQLAVAAEARLAGERPYSHADRWGSEFSMARDDLLSRYNEDTIAQLPRAAVRKAGLDPALVADVLGYDSLDDMIYTMTNAMPLKTAAREAAKAEMVRRYGEDYNSSEVVDLAIAQELADQGRLTVFAKELAALGRKAGRSPDEDGPRLFAKKLAKQTLEAKPIKAINAKVYQSAVVRYGRAAEKAVVAGDWAAAAEAKRKQLFAQALHNEATEVLKEVEKVRKKAARFTKTKVPGIAPDYIEQIIGIVERFEFAKRTGKRLAKRESLRAFLLAAEEDGQVTTVPEYLQDDAQRINYKELTTGELFDIRDSIDNLEFLGRRKNKFRKNKELREFEEVKSEILGQLAGIPKKPRKMRSMSEADRGVRGKVADLMAGLLKPEQIIEWLDLGELGAAHENLWMPLKRSLIEARDLEKDFNSRLKEAFVKLDPKRMREIVTIKEITDKDSSSNNFGKPLKLTYEEIFAIALNTGNESNLSKMLEGEGWNQQQLDAILRNLTADDAKTIQQIWDVIAGLWPKVVALEKRLTGVAPKMVEPAPTRIGGVTLAGGYYPIVYDFNVRRGLNLEVRPEPQDQQLVVTEETGQINWKFKNLNNRPGTNHKYTEARKKVARPLRFDLGIVPTHLHKVIHDLTHREAVRDVYKLLSDPEIRRGIEDVQGFEEYQQLMHWLRSTATPESTVEPPGKWWDVIKRARLNMTLVGLGFSFTAALAQPFGVFPAAQKMGSRWMVAGVNAMARDPRGMRDMVMAKSGIMRHRFNNTDRDIADTVNNWKFHDSFLNKVRLNAFVFIGFMDGYTASSIWLGAYAKQLALEPGNDAKAVDYADKLVNLTQGTGNVMDMARVQTLPGFKMFTLFYSFFSAQHNMQVDLYRKTKRDIVAGDWKSTAVDLGRWMNLVVVPAVLSAIFMGQGPDEEERESPEALAMWAAMTSAGFALGGIPIARDVANSLITGFDYAATPVQRVPESIIKVAGDLDRAVTDEMNPRRITMNSLMAFGYIAGAPVSQPRKTLDGIWGGLENDDFEIQDLLFGRRDKQ